MSSKSYLHIGTSLVSLIIVLVVFSSAIGPLPPLGDFLDPTGGGIFDVGSDSSFPVKQELSVKGLKGDVTVYRDAMGIPHIYSTYDSDLYFAVGYVQAQDRLFQLDIQRRLFSGTLSEILGNSTLENDIFFRSVGLVRSAKLVLDAIQKEADNGNKQSQNLTEALNAYTKGINTYIDEGHPAPFEFQLLSYQPTHWNPEDSIAFAKYMSFSLGFGEGEYDLKFATIVEKLGAQKAYELFPVNGSLQIPVTPNYGGYEMPAKYSFTSNGSSNGPVPSNAVNQIVSSEIAKASRSVDKVLENIYTNFGGMIDEFKGSNNWAISGSKSSTGHPILANDMHLQWSTPSIWYQMSVHSSESDLDVWGFIFIGSPFIVAGHNKDVAWGFTNVGGDVLDWYYFNTKDGQYSINNTWVNYNLVTESVKVKGKPDYPLTIKYTVEGPIIPGNDYQGMELAVSWIGIKDYDSLGQKAVFKAVHGFNQAHNYAEFKDAVYQWDGPAQNIIFADSDNIALWVAGVHPIRAPNIDGRLPVNGSAADASWHGYIAPQNWPHTYNPAQGYIASNNQKSAGPEYEYYIGSNYADGYRARRINYLLNSGSNIDVEKMKIIQTDTLDTSAEAFVPYLLKAITDKESTITTKPASWTTAITELQNWDYFMSKDASAPLIFSFFMNRYIPYTFEDEFSQAGLEDNDVPYPQTVFLDNMTLKDLKNHWFDNVSTIEVEENGQDIMLKAFTDALITLERDYGTIDKWTYGEYHKGSFDHLTGLKALSHSLDPINGSTFTLNPSGGRIANHGASERAIYDLSDLSNSVAALPGGQSGNPSSPHYHDLLDNYFLTWNYYSQIFYPDITKFPTESIESTIIFRRAE
jgi:penicillin amidase